MKMKLYVTVFFVAVGSTLVQPNREMGSDQREVEENFRNLFDSITINDMRKTETYRNYLVQKVVREYAAFNTIKERIQPARQSNADKERNPYRTSSDDIDESVAVFKRETRSSGDSDSIIKTSSPRQVFDAAEKSVEELKQILNAKKIPVTVTNSQKQTLAHIAAKANNVDVLRYVLEEDPNLLHALDGYQCTVLHLAVVKGSFDAVKYLVEEWNDDICYLSGRYKDRTALHVAIEFNHLNILKYFIEKRGIDFNVPNKNQTIPPIFLAVRHQNWDVIEYLIEEKKANVRLLKSNQENILFIVVRENFMSFLTYLLDEKKFEFNVDWKNYYGETPVHVAAILNRLEMLKYLVEKKFARVNMQKWSDKRTPLHYAASRNYFEVCEFLIEHGADASLTDNKGDTAADKATDPTLIKYLRTAAKSKAP